MDLERERERVWLVKELRIVKSNGIDGFYKVLKVLSIDNLTNCDTF